MSWLLIVPHIAKNNRYTLGTRIENTFLDLLEKTYTAYFTSKETKTKTEKITECIHILDTLKYFISVAWEGKVISNQQLETVANKLDEAGRRFGAWKKSLENPEKKNRVL